MRNVYGRLHMTRLWEIRSDQKFTTDLLLVHVSKLMWEVGITMQNDQFCLNDNICIAIYTGHSNKKNLSKSQQIATVRQSQEMTIQIYTPHSRWYGSQIKFTVCHKFFACLTHSFTVTCIYLERHTIITLLFEVAVKHQHQPTNLDKSWLQYHWEGRAFPLGAGW